MLPSRELAQAVRDRLEVGGVQVADLHLWDLAPGRRGCIVSLVTAEPQEVATYRSRLEGFHGISHVTVEIHRRPPPMARASGA
jgi:Co/Zn/Cd efflux system component